MKPILIAGGGIGGFAAALALARKGIESVIIERESELREAGAGIQLGPNVFTMFDVLGLTDAINEVAVFPEALVMKDALDASEVTRIPLARFRARHRQPIVHIERGAYGEVGRARAYAAIAVVLAPYLGVLVLFVAGVASVPLRRGTVLLFGFLVFYVLLHVAAHGYPRYRIPSLPVLFLVGGQGLVYLAAGASPASWVSGLRPQPARMRTARNVAVAARVAARIGTP